MCKPANQANQPSRQIISIIDGKKLYFIGERETK
jgi:hypothetical protein